MSMMRAWVCRVFGHRPFGMTIEVDDYRRRYWTHCVRCDKRIGPIHDLDLRDLRSIMEVLA